MCVDTLHKGGNNDDNNNDNNNNDIRDSLVGNE
jgi:hypothetical protein